MTFIQKAKALDYTKSVKYLLHNHLAGMEPDRGKDVVHASELSKDEGVCPREYALYRITKSKPGARYLSTAENVTFTMGTMLQDIVVQTFADMKKAIGHWRCRSCHHLHEFQLRPWACATCGSKAGFKAEEVRFQSAICGATCGVDLLLALGEPKLRPIEIKTIDKDMFKDKHTGKELVAPLAEHKLRTTFYLRLIAESDHPWASMVSTEAATILYVSKGGFGCQDAQLKTWGLKETFSPFKEFTITRDDKMVEALARRAKIVKDFHDGKIGMPCGVCPTAFAKRAKWCAQRVPCFSGEYPAQHQWKE